MVWQIENTNKTDNTNNTDDTALKCLYISCYLLVYVCIMALHAARRFLIVSVTSLNTYLFFCGHNAKVGYNSSFALKLQRMPFSATANCPEFGSPSKEADAMVTKAALVFTVIISNTLISNYMH